MIHYADYDPGRNPGVDIFGDARIDTLREIPIAVSPGKGGLLSFVRGRREP